MPTIRITQHLDSETPHLPELRPLIEKDVEIVVRETAPMPAPSDTGDKFPLRGSILRDDDPFRPA